MSILLTVVCLILPGAASAAATCQDIFQQSSLSAARRRILETQVKRIKKLQARIEERLAYENSPEYYNYNKNAEMTAVLRNEPIQYFLLHSHPNSELEESKTSHLPSYSLSLENGRQALDVIRISFDLSENAEWTIANFIDYLSVLEKIPSLKLLVTVQRDDKSYLDKLIAQQNANLRSRIEVIESQKEVDHWNQDNSKPADLPKFTIASDPDKYTDVLDSVRASGKIFVEKPFDFQFEGGDIVVGDRHVIVGVNQLRLVSKWEFEKALRMLAHAFKKPVILAGVRNYGIANAHDVSAWEPWSFHIDLDMVLAVDRNTNDEVALVHSPSAFFKLLAPEIALSKIPTLQEIKNLINVILDNMKKKAEGGEVLAK